MAEIIIHDGNAHEHQTPPAGGAKGLIPRDFAAQPVGCMMAAPAFDLPLIPESEWADRFAAQVAAKSRLSDIRNRGMNGQPIPSRDQNGKGYCWFHSGTSGSMLVRAINGEPYADLSAYMGACLIKNYRDEGGNGIDGVQFISETGICTSQFWPQQSMSRGNDTPAMRANAALHKFTEWKDLDPNNMKAQLVTCLLLGMPVVSDFNWWSHSVLSIDIVSLNPFQTRIWNSWGDSWSENGTGVLSGQKAIPDNGIALAVMTPSQV